MQQQSVGGLCVVVTLFVEVTELVQVPGGKQHRVHGSRLRESVILDDRQSATFIFKQQTD